MKANVDRETCIGCGACVSVCPDGFEMDEGKATATGDCDDLDCCQSAADSCPVNAIEIEE